MELEQSLEPSFLEKLIVKSMLEDKNFMFLVTNVFEPRYFQENSIKQAFKVIREHVNKYTTKPTRDIIINSLPESSRADVINLFSEMDSIDFDLANQYDYIITETNLYLKNRSLSYAIMDGVDIIEDGGDLAKIRELVEVALCKDIKVELGLNYFKEIADRLKRIQETAGNRLKSYYPLLDEYINGGFPPYTLSVFLGKVHGFKSNVMANLAARQVLNGHNVLLMTLEMSEDAFAQRFDSIFTSLDINKIYVNSDVTRKLIQKLGSVKKQKDRGELFIKHFPPGISSVNEYRSHIRELTMRDIELSVIYVDYINLMKPSYNSKGDLYGDVKRISEELRALSFEFEIPVVSVSQLNREGMFVGFDEVDFNYISESIGVAATADFIAILGVDRDKLIYENEIHSKIVKNRLGGRVGSIFKFLYDSRSLKMYDEVEEQEWINDATSSGDSRNPPEEMNE